MIARVLLAAALLGCAAITVTGMLAPVYPPADFLNHFRPFALAGSCVLLIAALALHAPRQAWAGGTLAALNAVLLVLPLLWSAESAERSTAGQALASAGGRDLKIVTFNALFGKIEPIARLLLAEDADIVVLPIAAARAGLPDRSRHDDARDQVHLDPHRSDHRLGPSSGGRAAATACILAVRS